MLLIILYEETHATTSSFLGFQRHARARPLRPSRKGTDLHADQAAGTAADHARALPEHLAACRQRDRTWDLAHALERSHQGDHRHRLHRQPVLICSWVIPMFRV